MKYFVSGFITGMLITISVIIISDIQFNEETKDKCSEINKHCNV